MKTTLEFIQSLEACGVSIERSPSDPSRLRVGPGDRLTPDLITAIEERKADLLEALEGPEETPLAALSDPMEILERMEFGAVMASWSPSLAFQWLRKLYAPALGGGLVLEEETGSIRFEIPSGTTNSKAVLGAAFALEMARPYILEHRDLLERRGLLRVIPRRTGGKK